MSAEDRDLEELKRKLRFVIVETLYKELGRLVSIDRGIIGEAVDKVLHAVRR